MSDNQSTRKIKTLVLHGAKMVIGMLLTELTDFVFSQTIPLISILT